MKSNSTYPINHIGRSRLTLPTSTASASLVFERLISRTSSASAIGSAGTDLTTSARSLGLGGTRGAIGRFAAGAWTVGTAAGVSTLTIVTAGAWQNCYSGVKRISRMSFHDVSLGM